MNNNEKTKSDFEMEEDGACDNCSECKCFSCKLRDSNINIDAYECNRCFSCENIPMNNCADYQYSDY